MKRIRDYTLGELVEMCTHTSCPSCDMKKIGEGCRFAHKDYPSQFDLSETPRFTPEEVERAEALIRLFGYRDNARIRRYSSGLLEVFDNDNLGEHRQRLEMGAFPSIAVDESFTIDEIIASGKEDKDHD